MITGMHVVIHTCDAEADRAFFRDVVGLISVDAGGGWLIFAAPPSEVACHPATSNDRHELYLMCDNLQAEMGALSAKGVECSQAVEARWGSITKIRLPGGGEIGLYEPKHPRPVNICSSEL